MIPEQNTLSHCLPYVMRRASHIGAKAAGQMAVINAYRNGMIGCFLDAEQMPSWARQAARDARAWFRERARGGWKAEDAICAASQGKGRGQRAVHFQHAMRLDSKILHGAQDYNNCTSWCFREVAGCAIACDLAYIARPGTAGIYGYRGSRADNGMAIYLGATAIHEHGVGLEIDYPGVADLSTEAADERAGVQWGGSGPPQAFRDAVAGLTIEQASEVTEEDAILDILQAGHFIGTGSTLTADSPGDPVSRLTSIGGHAQAMIGYDDTDEFRQWYQQTTGKRLDDWVAIFDQSWPPGWIKMENWPDHLWGPRPDGAFVLRGQDAMKMVDTRFGAAIACSKRKEYPVLDLKPWKEVLGWL